MAGLQAELGTRLFEQSPWRLKATEARRAIPRHEIEGLRLEVRGTVFAGIEGSLSASFDQDDPDRQRRRFLIGEGLGFAIRLGSRPTAGPVIGTTLKRTRHALVPGQLGAMTGHRWPIPRVLPLPQPVAVPRSG